MKTFRNIYPQVWDFVNLLLASRKARRHKRWKNDAMAFERRLEENLWELHAELSSLSWQPGPGRQFRIRRPKERLITAAPYRDRVVHHAICNVIEPVLDARFIHNSYACRQNKGTHAAHDKCQHHLRHCRYGFRGDIHRYFPSIDHTILLKHIERWFVDKELMEIIKRIVTSHTESADSLQYFPGDDLFTPTERHRGLPIGNLTSQLFANLYLNDLDHFVTRELKCSAYLRYMDDFMLFSDDKDFLQNARMNIEEFLGDQLRLRPHPKKSQVFATKDGAPFLGFHLYPRRRRILKVNVTEFKHRFSQHRREFRTARLTLDELNSRVRGWIGHAAHGDTYRLRQNVLAGLTL